MLMLVPSLLPPLLAGCPTLVAWLLGWWAQSWWWGRKTQASRIYVPAHVGWTRVSPVSPQMGTKTTVVLSRWGPMNWICSRHQAATKGQCAMQNEARGRAQNTVVTVLCKAQVPDFRRLSLLFDLLAVFPSSLVGWLACLLASCCSTFEDRFLK